MRIHYKATVDSIVAFNLYHFANSPTWRRQLCIQSLMLPGVLLLLIIVGRSAFAVNIRNGQESFWSAEHIIAAAIIWLLVSAAWIAFVRWNAYQTLARRTRQLWNEGDKRNQSKWVSMELVNRRLVVDTDFMRSVLDLRAIEKFATTDQYTFLYISSLAAHVIPISGEHEENAEFVAALKAAWQHRGDAPPLPEAADRPAIDDRFIERLPR